MTRQATMLTILSAAVAAAGGCSAFRTAPPMPATQSPTFNALWDASTETLRHHHFKIDRADRRAGVITTFPLLGRHWFEFWRADARTPRDVAEGTLQSIYRTATVRIRPAEAPAGRPDMAYATEVDVRTSRSARPNVRVTSTSEAYDLFVGEGADERTPALPEAEGPVDAGKAGPVDVGEDPRLAELLLEEIRRRAAAKLATAPAPATRAATRPAD